ncbi:carbohydrate kinase family protein [Microterricola viridarii]|uniref:Sugar or nucleoside kinase, ribokinase family n=1 Tax=Microterricola viridarii TaxID=412690 RepID=A0A1H1LDD5_9MICO|nr:PfkB family carbohydrate kinase [Microterricola viridarii]SDR72332.1 Sugar or nucleoside kinase, ribokinase family [Microterricola viridarii]
MTGAPPVFIAGPASWNHIVQLDALPDPTPHMQFAEADWHTVGGTSAGKALHLAELGVPVALHTLLGEDADGAHLRALLGAVPGIELIATTVPGQSERHLNLMDPRGGRVSLYLSSPAAPGSADAAAPRIRTAQQSALRSAEAAVLDLAPLGIPLLAEAREAGVPVWTDIHDYDGSASFHQPFIDAASFVFMNADKIGDPLPFARQRIAAGSRLVVCTLGADGAVAVDENGEVHRVEAVPVPTIVDTNGAGDAFFAGYLAASLGGAGVADALTAAARQAARALGTRHLSPLLDGSLQG